MAEYEAKATYIGDSYSRDIKKGSAEQFQSAKNSSCEELIFRQREVDANSQNTRVYRAFK